ncbi:hypothetical protein VTL71DRAFT_7644 [Oculimacula yallundae]|uniref:F-box domain-containing protein n=1 Tax=Oculimacula yallundae TaxID=86028 RepID=A0ABR4BVW3_9HELO
MVDARIMTSGTNEQSDDLVNSLAADGCVQSTDKLLNITIDEFPTEILLMIFDILQAGDRYITYQITCLGLASPRLYLILKDLEPGTICSRVGGQFTDRNEESWDYKLQFHIGNFLGPDYRRRVYDRRFDRRSANDIPFLPRSIYGDEYGEEEKALNERYFDWKSSIVWMGDERLRPF